MTSVMPFAGDFAKGPTGDSSGEPAAGRAPESNASPTARQALLRAARAALADRPWPRIRMVEVAAAAGFSRQTLYSEFGSKDGLGAALVARELEVLLDRTARAAQRAARSASRTVSGPAADPVAGCAAAAVSVVRAACRDPLVRAALTGCWESRLPPPGPEADRAAAGLRDRTAAALVSAGAAAGGTTGPAALRHACEVGLRLALSYVVAPCDGPPEATEEAAGTHVTQVLRALLH
ncbi:TetR/AcrR family transcriptional regulator [Streptomyces sp. S1A]|uniref:TetR/AcrR family transcriptional regulator n=1 Tax=Streptomyces sp. ICN903 TaxID=2964654 RepID=UPI001ED9F74E|nr:TetR/AcrR family transcriptional regulator [Streptomyces sp. ICN903]MCG3039499.1 TetR/AcrR family transcriptional regulator [Streptomyces sp. ICN903]